MKTTVLTVTTTMLGLTLIIAAAGLIGPVTLASAAAREARIVEPSSTDPQTWGYRPQPLNVRARESITWTNSGGVPHTVTADDGRFDSGTIAPKGTWSFTPPAGGTFNYHCALHPWMKATLVVAGVAEAPGAGTRMTGSSGATHKATVVPAAAAEPARSRAAGSADAPSIAITSPARGAKVATTDIPVKVEVRNFTLRSDRMGKPDARGEGHWHVMLDGMDMAHLIMPAAAESFTIPGTGVAPGQHTILAVLATNEHEPVMVGGKPVMSQQRFDYEPARPAPAPSAFRPGGEPAVRITSPATGANVAEKFTVSVDVQNVRLNQDLEGKTNVPGWGHLHVFVDNPKAEGERGMVGMPGMNRFEVDLSGFAPGPHEITVVLAGNDHVTIVPVKRDSIRVTWAGTGAPSAFPRQSATPSGFAGARPLFNERTIQAP